MPSDTPKSNLPLTNNFNNPINQQKNQKNISNSEGDVLVVGVSPDYPPFEYTEDGKIVGFDIDFMHILGEKMGKKIEIKEMEFSSLIPSLNSGKINLIISSLSKNPEREKNVSFS